MDKKEKDAKGNGGRGKGALYVIGIGPGGIEELTRRALVVIGGCDAVVGYTRYVDLLSPVTGGKELFTTGMTHEVERCRKAIELSGAGRRVAVVSSGDAGIYGMAGLVLELISSGKKEGVGNAFTVEVIPGVPAFVSAASILGAPLMHDFASISLSDLLTPWEKIERRVSAAGAGDFVIIFYNPKSSKRTEGIKKAVRIVRKYRDEKTPVGIVRNAAREGEETRITTLGGIEDLYEMIDMLTVVIIGNSGTFVSGSKMITPRGYRGL